MKHKIEYIALDKLSGYETNSRTHSTEQVAQIAASITEFGFTNPILIDEKNTIIAGHGRLEAAKRLDIDEAPCLRLSHLTESQKKAYVIADNKLALNAGWDDDLLRLEIQNLQDDGFNIDLLGFSDDELSNLFQEEEEQPGLTDEDEVPEPPEEPVSKLGDVWILGNHRLMCGDSTSLDDVAKLMNGAMADLVWTDPPYNVAIQGAAGSILNDDMSDGAFRQFLRDVYSAYFSFMRDGAVIYVSHADSERVNFTAAFVESGLKLSQILIWVKDSATLSRQDFNWQHEPIIYGWKEGVGHFFCEDYTQTTVIDDDLNLKKLDKKQLVEIIHEMREGKPATAIRQNRPTKSDLHPTMKPVNLVQRMIEWSSRKNEIVLDLFGGSGTTLIASEQTKRQARLMELDPKYCDVIIKRWQDFTGKQAIMDGSSVVFDDLVA